MNLFFWLVHKHPPRGTIFFFASKLTWKRQLGRGSSWNGTSGLRGRGPSSLLRVSGSNYCLIISISLACIISSTGTDFPGIDTKVWQASFKLRWTYGLHLFCCEDTNMSTHLFVAKYCGWLCVCMYMLICSAAILFCGGGSYFPSYLKCVIWILHSQSTIAVYVHVCSQIHVYIIRDKPQNGIRRTQVHTHSKIGKNINSLVAWAWLDSMSVAW